jgi:hypothetical protein
VFVAYGRGSNSGRGHNPRGPRGGRGLPNKCNTYGSLDIILSSCTALDDTLLKWTLAKRKMIVQKYGTPSGFVSAHAALLNDVPADDYDILPTLENYTDGYDDTEVSVPFNSVAFSSSLTRGRDLSQFWVVDSSCSTNFAAFRSDFVTFTPPSAPFRVGGVGFDVTGNRSVRISIRLASGHLIHRAIHALYYAPDLSSRSAQRIGRLFSVSWMQSHSGFDLFFFTNSDTELLMVPTKWVC